jgi:hypothetical protein
MGLAPSGATYWSQFTPVASGLRPGALSTPSGPQQSTQPVTPPNGTPSQPVSGGSGQDAQALIASYQQAHPVGGPGGDIPSLVAFLNQHGVNATQATHAGGTQLSGDKIVLPDSSVLDLISNQGGANQAWGNTSDGYFVNGQPSTTPASVGLTPPPPDGGSGAGGNNFSGLQGNGPLGQFLPLPTGLDYTNDPGYQARMQLGTDAIQNSAAAKGDLLSGKTLTDLNSFAQDYGSNEYANAFQRALSSQGQAFGQNFSLASLGQQATDQINGAGMNTGNQSGTYLTNNGQGQAGNDINQGNQIAGATNNLGSLGLQTYYRNQLKPPVPGLQTPVVAPGSLALPTAPLTPVPSGY